MAVKEELRALFWRYVATQIATREQVARVLAITRQTHSAKVFAILHPPENLGVMSFLLTFLLVTFQSCYISTGLLLFGEEIHPVCLDKSGRVLAGLKVIVRHTVRTNILRHI